MKLDLSSLKNIKEFTGNWDMILDGLINNAGVQFTARNNFTSDGFEETIAGNHPASFLLTVGMGSSPKNGRVSCIGSGAHNPVHSVAKMFGFREAKSTSVKMLSEGEDDITDIIKPNPARHSTSKLPDTITAVKLSRRYKTFSSFVLDPRLMPGAGLTRNQNQINKSMWRRLMPITGKLVTQQSRNAAKTPHVGL